MKIETLINELEKIHSLYPESDVWVEAFEKETTENFDFEILITDTEVETTIKMRR